MIDDHLFMLLILLFKITSLVDEQQGIPLKIPHTILVTETQSIS